MWPRPSQEGSMFELHEGELLMQSATVLWRNVGDTVVLAAQDSEGFEELSPTAAAVWRLLENPRALPDLVEALAIGYDVRPEEIAVDVGTLIRDLEAEDALETIVDADD